MDKYSKNSLFQNAWDQWADLKYWRFQVLDRAQGKVAANHREAELIAKVPSDKRLNIGSSSPRVSYVQKQQITDMLHDGIKGCAIAKAVGVSPATVSKIKQETMFATQ